jgi:hypothetical protein
VANGSLWFAARGWISAGILPGILSVPLAAAACAAAFFAALRQARPALPRRAVACAAGVILFLVSLAVSPRPSYAGRLFRSAMYGVFSGLDPSRQELRSVAESASTESEKRQAVAAWRRYGPR